MQGGVGGAFLRSPYSLRALKATRLGWLNLLPQHPGSACEVTQGAKMNDPTNLLAHDC